MLYERFFQVFLTDQLLQRKVRGLGRVSFLADGVFEAFCSLGVGLWAKRGLEVAAAGLGTNGTLRQKNLGR